MARTKTKTTKKKGVTKTRKLTLVKVPKLTRSQMKVQELEYTKELYQNKERTMKSLAVIVCVLSVAGAFYWINSEFGSTAVAVVGIVIAMLVVAFATAILQQSAVRHGSKTIVEGIQATVGVLAANAQVERYHAATQHEYAKMQRISHETDARRILQDEKLLEQAIQNRVKLLGTSQQAASSNSHWSQIDSNTSVEVWDDEEEFG